MNPTAWAWPLPNCVPFEIPRGDSPNSFGVRAHAIYLPAPIGQAVHAVEEGTIRRRYLEVQQDPRTSHPAFSISVDGPCGTVTYGGVHPESNLKEGDQVTQGQRLGFVTLSTSTRNDTCFLDLVLSSEGLIQDPTPNLIEAWCRVTNRFHRDAPDTPKTPEERRAMVQWLQEHKLWTHPSTIHVPPDFDENPASIFGDPDAEDGDLLLVPLLRDGPGWVDKEFDDGSLQECMNIEYVYVCPTTERIEGPNGWATDPRNTDFRVWLEAGGWYDQGNDLDESVIDQYNRWLSSHDTALDCGAHTLEEALLQLAVRVQFFYGDGKDHRVDTPQRCEGTIVGRSTRDERYVSGCQDAGDGFCSTCGFLIDPRSDRV